MEKLEGEEEQEALDKIVPVGRCADTYCIRTLVGTAATELSTDRLKRHHSLLVIDSMDVTNMDIPKRIRLLLVTSRLVWNTDPNVEDND